MNRNSILSFVVVFAGVSCLIATTAQSQVGPPKAFVSLQPTTPGVSQSGHANVSGTMRASQFIGGGAGLTNVNAALLAGLGSSAFGKLNSANVWTHNNTFSGGINTFNGNGNGLTNLNAGNISAGTLNDARLSSNVALLDDAQSFTGSNVFTGGFVTTAFQLAVGGATDYVLKSNSFGTGTWQPDGLTMPESDSVSGTGTGLAFTHTGTGDLAIFTINNAASVAEAVQGVSNGGGDVFQATMTGTGRAGYFSSGSGIAGYFTSSSGTAVRGIASDVDAYGAEFTNSSSGSGATALFVEETATTSNVTYGIHAIARGTSATAVYGVAFASGNTGYGVIGNCPSTGWGLYALGDSGASGTKAFRIDHPSDPENKYLLHYSAEGPEPQNIYNGTITTDAQGKAWVTLPHYFADINKNPRYQLTVIDDSEGPGFVQVKVARKIQGNRFMIMTSAPNVEVSWEVKAKRNDRWMQEYGAPVEQDKPQSERGRYQHPELFGQPTERGLHYRAPSEPDSRPRRN